MQETATARDGQPAAMLMLLVVVLVLAVPLRLAVPVPGPEARRALMCVLELLFVLPYLATVARRSTFVTVPPLAGLVFGAWMLSAAASIVVSPYWQAALARQTEWTTHILFATCLWHFLKHNRGMTRRVMTLAMLGAVVAALIVFKAWLDEPNPELVTWRRYLPLFSHVRHFGYYALGGLILSHLWVADPGAGRVRVLWSVVIASVLWGALIWTGGRAALVSALLGVAAIAVLSPTRRWAVAGTTALALPIGSVIAALTTAGRPELGWRAILRRLDPTEYVQFTSNRTRFWELAFENFQESPILGLGPDAYRFLQPKIFGSHPHNVILQFLTDYGVVGTVLFGILFLLCVAVAFGHTRDRADDLRGERVVALAMIFAFSAHALLDGTFYHAVPLMLIAVCVAVGLQPDAYESSAVTAGRTVFSVRTGLANTVAMLCVGLIGVYSLGLANMLARGVPDKDSARARVVRVLPGATNSMNLELWIRSWSKEDPVAASEWAHWAHQHSPDAYRFSSLEAQLLADLGFYEAAHEHALMALGSARGRLRTNLAAALAPIIKTGEAYSGQMLFEVPEK